MNSCYIQNNKTSQRQNACPLDINKLKMNRNEIQRRQSKSKERNPYSKIKLNENSENSQRKSLAPTSAEDQLPQPNCKAPKPIVQTKIRKTHCEIQDIPIPLRPQRIQQLYLSHNKIMSVKNKLRVFTSLRNLNLSYNLLSNVQQFISQILGQNIYKVNKLQNSHEVNDYNYQKIQLKMLNLRMNKFYYGYEDQIIKYIKSLSKFEQYSFIQQKTSNQTKQSLKKISNNNQIPNQQRQLIFSMASKVSEYFIPAYCRIQASISKITDAFQNYDHNNSAHLIYKANKQLFITRYEQAISKLSMLIKPTKQLTYIADSRFNSLKNILQYQLICLELQDKQGKQTTQQINGWIWQNKQGLSYQSYIMKMFKDIFRSILFRFNFRKNYLLKDSLKQYIKTNNSKQKQIQNQHIQSQQYFEQLANAFGTLYGARKYKIHQTNPGKYLQKINIQKVKEHPFIQYVTFDKKQYYKDMMTLDGQRIIKNKNTLLKQLNNYKQQDKSIIRQRQQQNWRHKNFFQNIPVIVYQRNYLQVITSILEDKVKQFMRIYDCFMRKFNTINHVKQNYQQSDSLQKMQRSKIYINSSPYLQEPKQNLFTYSPSSEQKNNNVHKKQKQTIIVKGKQKIKIVDNQIPENNYHSSINNLQERPTISKFRPNIQQQLNSRQTQSSISFKDLMQKKEESFQQQKNKRKHNKKIQKNSSAQKTTTYTQMNLNKYTLHQINLVYKVLRALKKYKHKMKKKREKALNQQIKL